MQGKDLKKFENPCATNGSMGESGRCVAALSQKRKIIPPPSEEEWEETDGGEKSLGGENGSVH